MVKILALLASTLIGHISTDCPQMGIEIDDKRVVVVVIEDSVADAAGVRTGDLVTKITDSSGKPCELYGPPHTVVHLSITRVVCEECLVPRKDCPNCKPQSDDCKNCKEASIIKIDGEFTLTRD